MIAIVSGVPGAGKTLYSVSMLFDDLCKGHTVVTNIELVWPELCRLAERKRGVKLLEAQYMRLNPEEAKEWHKHIPWGDDSGNVKVYLDEIHLFYNARDWQSTGTENRGLLKFLSQHRKAKTDIVFIAQEKENVEKQFRVLAEWEFAIVSSEHVPLGFLMPLLNFFWRCFIVRKRDLQNGSNGNKFEKLWREYDPKLFRCYNSYAFLDKEMAELGAERPRIGRQKLERVSLFRRLGMNLAEPVRLWVAKLKRKEVKHG